MTEETGLLQWDIQGIGDSAGTSKRTRERKTDAPSYPVKEMGMEMEMEMGM